MNGESAAKMNWKAALRTYSVTTTGTMRPTPFNRTSMAYS
jgi:hypothetical protein